MALGLTQPLTEMSTRKLPGGEGRPVDKTDTLTAICVPIYLENVGASTSHNPMGLHELYLDNFAFLPFTAFVYNVIRSFFLSHLS
jgi:hypothetical protein